MINIAFGGSLHQDILEAFPQALTHREASIYEKNFHEVTFTKEKQLAELYRTNLPVQVNSVHHQAVKDLGTGLIVEAVSIEDGIIEAISLPRKHKHDAFCLGVQWHPEFQDRKDASLLDPKPLLHLFKDAIRQ